jgi:hypothetical protein
VTTGFLGRAAITGATPNRLNPKRIGFNSYNTPSFCNHKDVAPINL